MSLMVQPAPLMMKAPKPNSISILRSGRHPGTALSAMLQPHGQNSSQEPAAYKYRVSCMTTQTGYQSELNKGCFMHIFKTYISTFMQPPCKYFYTYKNASLKFSNT